MNWTIRSAVEQIQKCGFECEGGSIENNVAWRWLVKTAAEGPEFHVGQRVWAEVTAEAHGVTLSKWVDFVIVRCVMDSDAQRVCFSYDLSRDPPGPSHYGGGPLMRVNADQIRVNKPDAP